MTKILIGVTCYSRKKYILDKFIDSLRSINKDNHVIFIDNSKEPDYAAYIRSKGFKVTRIPFIVNLHERLTEAYNVLRIAFLKGSYTHLMILEQDIFPPTDVIKRLLEHDKEIVSGVYWIKDKPCVLIDNGYMSDEERKDKGSEFSLNNKIFKYDFIDKKRLEEKDLIRVFACGLGCVMIKRSIMQKIKFRVQKNLDNEWKGHNDMFFYFDLRTRDIPVFVDPTIKCGHENDNY